MSALSYILDKYELHDQKSPINLVCSRWNTLPRLFRQVGYKLGAEVGVAGGRFSKVLCEHNPQLKLYSIDAWKVYEGYKDNESQKKMERLFREAKRRLEPFNCHIVRDWSAKAAERFEDESLDFVFLDANHDYEHVKEDIATWAPKVRKDGIVCGHDYMNRVYRGVTYGVKQAVNEWVEENNIDPLIILTRRYPHCWLYVK